MEYNVYAPPGAVVADIESAERAPAFYVVSRTKFFVLFVMTLGLYQIYWAYAHWANQRRVHKLSILPAARSLFQVFYTHSLAREIDKALVEGNARYAWSPMVAASVVVILNLASALWSRVADSMLGEMGGLWATIAAVVPVACACWWMQKAANVASGDALGESNRKFTLANWIWMLLWGVWWLLIVAGSLVMLSGGGNVD